MRIVGIYSFNNGQGIIESEYALELHEVQQVVASVDSSVYKTKRSREKTMRDKLLYSPKGLNKGFKNNFEGLGWQTHRVRCDYPQEYYVPGYQINHSFRGAYREMDFIKNRVGVEVQFGKYAFMVYNVCAKMTIFHNLGLIDVGIEIVPVKEFADEMSTGVSYFEQFVWDLQQRGVADIDIPVLILGIAQD